MKKRTLSFLLSLAVAASMALLPASALEVEDARQLLRDHYVDIIPKEILSLDSLDAILSALNDPYTVYLSAEDYQNLLETVNGETLVGIGVSIQTAYDVGFSILSVLPDSPALEAGLEAGDRLVAVNGQRLTATSDILGLIGGEEGTPVTITVIRLSTGQEMDFTMVRRTVTIPIVTYHQEGDVGLIDCKSFGSSTVSTMREAILAMDDDTTVWVLDLRSNPGGSAQAAAGAAGLFAGSGTMAYFRYANDAYSYLQTPPTYQDLTDKPLIVLTGPYSASGSELFAGAARDHGVAISIGLRTYGKGVAQNVYDETQYPDLFDGDGLKITTSRFYSPNGTTNHIVGVLPTLLVELKHSETIARLLSASLPTGARNTGYLKLDFGSFPLYLSLREGLKEENRESFTALLEAIPVGLVSLYRGDGDWHPVSPGALAAELGLDYHSRGGFSDLPAGEDLTLKVETLAAYHLVSGYKDGTFRPENAITRAEFCTLVGAALDLPASEAALPFSDTDPAAWYAGPVSAMAARGFVSGYGDGTFRPNDTISYEEMVTILSAVAAWVNLDGYNLSREELDLDAWCDFYFFADWAMLPASVLTDLGLKLDCSAPAAPASRAQAAGLLFDLMDAANLLWGDF